jgi:hypothetical protein
MLVLYSSAYGYIDPASGSYFLQILLAGALAALFALKMFWRNIKNFLSRMFSHKSKSESDDR